MERKEFLNLVGTSMGAILLNHCVSGCTYQKDEALTPSTNPNTPTKKDFKVSLNDAAYAHLKNNGSYTFVNDIILARTKTGDFIALGRYCTHQGTSVEFRPAPNDVYCSNHGSRFSTAGKVLAGPASEPLKQYNTSYDATKLEVRVYES
ncbi:MAG: Rieske 2Fe-2S domain-containing protein [Spirosomataceae bacterium]